MKKFNLYIFIFLLILACSKSDDAETEIEIIEEEIEQLYSCVTYSELLDPQNTNQDDALLTVNF